MTGLYKEQKFLLLSLLSLSLLPVCPTVFRPDQRRVNTGSVVEQQCHLVAILWNSTIPSVEGEDVMLYIPCIIEC